MKSRNKALALCACMAGGAVYVGMGMASELKLPRQVGATIQVEAFDPLRHAAFRAEMMGRLAPLQPSAFVLLNSSAQAITGLAVRYVITDRTGVQKGFRYFCDSYMLTTFRPVLAPGARMLIAPHTFLPEALVSAGHVGVAPSTVFGRGARTEQMIAEAASIEVEIDAVIFTDGGVAGPDTLKFPAEITARKVAARRIAGKLKEAAATGKTADQFLRQHSEQPARKGDLVALWTRRFADEATRARSNQDMAPFFENMLEPPAFHPAP